MHQHERESNLNLLNFDIRKTQKQRLKNQRLKQAMFGLFAYFEDTQIRDREGPFSSLYHASDADIRPKSRVTLWPGLKTFSGISLPMFLPVRNRRGEWASQLHALPEHRLIGNSKKARLSVQDSNMYVTAFCALSLTTFSEKELDDEARLLGPMIAASRQCIDSYRNGKAYNFWPEEEAVYGSHARRGPLNIWVQIAEKMLRLLIKPGARQLFRRSSQDLELPSFSWLEQCLSNPQNDQGADAIFNICNDADDTAVAVALEYLDKGAVTPEMKAATDEILCFRDIGRSNKSINPFEQWKENNSGAFLTWLKAEHDNPFTNSQKGLIPGGINNVDIVVNANVLYCLALIGETGSEAVRDCIELLCKAVEAKAWPGAGLYYPQQMMFPYAFSRAVRDGHLTDKKLHKAQAKLMKDVLELAIADKGRFYFAGGKDKSTHFSTALGLLSLLNMGEDLATNIGKQQEYRAVLEGCVDYLLDEVRFRSCLFKSTRERFQVKARTRFIPQWEDGLFFGPVHWDLCHWRAQSVTHACVLEAFNKYLLAYDKGANSHTHEQNRLAIRSYHYKDLLKDCWLSIA